MDGFLRTERRELERLLPGLDERLAAHPFLDLESEANPSIAWFRDLRGPNLLVPRRHGGLGATALQAIRVHRALGSRAPSLAIAATMHGFSAAAAVWFAEAGDEFATAFVEGVARDALWLASGYAEGRPGTNIFVPALRARRTADGGWVLSGSKKPCSLCRSMHFAICSVAAEGRRGIAVVPADVPGLSRRPFWKSQVLAGAETEELVLDEVVLPGDFVLLAESDEALDPVERAGYVWFQLVLSASYLGAASGLVERALASGRGPETERAQLAIELESAMASLEGLARAIDAGEDAAECLPRALLVRYGVQGAIERSAARAVEILSGLEFIRSPEVLHLFAASRALAFHPPARLAASAGLAHALQGGALPVL